MSEKKGFVRKNQTQTSMVEELEKTVEQLNTETAVKKPTKENNENKKPYSYSIKLNEDLNQRVEEATQKHRYTKKAFFLLAIEKLLEQLGH